MSPSTIPFVDSPHADAWKAHDGPVSFLKDFNHFSDTCNTLATGSHDKSVKFWSLPTVWLEFKKAAKAKHAKAKAEAENKPADLPLQNQTPAPTDNLKSTTEDQQAKPLEDERRQSTIDEQSKTESNSVVKTKPVDKADDKKADLKEAVEKKQEAKPVTEDVKLKPEVKPEEKKETDGSEDLIQKSSKKKQEKGNLFDSDGEEAGEFK